MLHRRHISSMSIVLALGISWTVAAANGSMNWRLPANKNFPLVGGNWGNQRYSTLDQINRSNVKKLGGAWMMHLEDGKTARQHTRETKPARMLRARIAHGELQMYRPAEAKPVQRIDLAYTIHSTSFPFL